MSLTLSRIDRVYRHYDVTATLADGSPATLSGASIALLSPGSKPSGGTVWTPATYTAGVATVLLAGPDADATGATTVPSGGADLWIRVVDTPEINALKAERIVVP